MARNPVRHETASDDRELSVPDASIIREAAHWLMLLNTDPVSRTDLEAWEKWRHADPRHEHAWRKAEILRGKLGALSPALSVPVLSRDHGTQRRAVLKTLGLAGIATPMVWLSWQYAPWQRWRSTYGTTAGEQRLVKLEDGSTVLLNTRTSLDTRYTQTERLLVLHEGEILVTTAGNTADSRPFFVETPQGRMQALGTRFMVHTQAASNTYPETQASTSLAVLEHRVAITLQGMAEPSIVLHAGEKTTFNTHAIQAVQAVGLQDAGWSQGVIYANDMPLETFLKELGRYRSGVIRVSPEAATLRLSGAFQLPDTDNILRIIASTLPITLQYRTRYWVQVNAR